MNTPLTSNPISRKKPQNHLEWLIGSDKTEKYYPSQSYNSRRWNNRRVSENRLAY